MASASGDRASYNEFVARHQAALFRYTKAISDSPSEAEEALQQAFVSAWLGAGSFRGPGNARGWLFRIARNAGHKMHRLRAGQPSEHESLEELGCQAGWNAGLPPLSEQIADRQWVSQALATLPLGDQEILLLVEVEGFSLSESAETLNLSLPAIKSRLHRARLRLVASLRKEANHA